MADMQYRLEAGWRLGTGLAPLAMGREAGETPGLGWMRKCDVLCTMTEEVFAMMYNISLHLQRPQWPSPAKRRLFRGASRRWGAPLIYSV
jgi:hypothetical protein